MIPIRLELKNFMAYRDAEPLDLSGLHVVSLVGENGAGKSTLLDAMTWAVWGQARAKRDDELIAQGETEMRVGFVFQEGAEIYQIVRTRKLSRASKGKAVTSTGQLELFVKDEATGWRTLSEARATETQDKIIRTLNLSYDTFINSAFLKQGRADEFTVKSPGQRKELLAEILNLDVWQVYEARAKEQLAALERNAVKLNAELTQAEQELARLPDLERQLGEAQSVLKQAQEELAQAEALQRELDRQRERVQQLRSQAVQTQQRAQAIDAEIGKLDAARADHDVRHRRFQSALDAREEIESGYARLAEARAQADAFNLKLQSLMGLNTRKIEAENKIADARRALDSERDAAQRRLDDARAKADLGDLARRLNEIGQRMAYLKAADAERTTLAQERLTAGEEQGEARAQNESLRREMNEIKQRIDALSSVGAICPTCGRALLEEDRTRLLGELRQHGKLRGDAYRANETRVKKINDARMSLDERIAAIERELAAMPALQREEAALNERKTTAEMSALQLPELESSLRAAEAQLTRGEFAAAARSDLARVEHELGVLGYDAGAHKRIVEADIPSLTPFLARKSELDKAALGLESERRALETLAAQRTAAEQKRDAEHAQLEQQRQALREAEAELVRESEASAQLAQKQSALFDAQRKLGAANQRVQACRALSTSAQRLRQELDGIERKQALYEELRQAYGKNGVPAMIIESVLPELESSANALLGRMSAGRMTVRFETQRLTQKGDTNETLEIRINDEIGERAYEMFSGGEAFRINFAIRIALSRLLARRAGARLRTLFIDEGFGTQDAQGRERLVDAIRVIEDDFEKIFIITHIEELRDAFPARIEVTKTEKGSSARVV